MTLTGALAIVLTVNSAVALAQVELPARLGLATTAALFEKIRVAPGFDLSKPALFGYFFNSDDPGRIATIRGRLEAEGFQFVETHVDSKGRTWLQVARVEIDYHETLVERNHGLMALATEVGGVQYDGWDITRNAR